MSSLVYLYGCKAPTSGWDYALAEQERCTILWDQLVEIDRSIERQTLQAAELDVPEIATLSEQIATLSARLKEEPKDTEARTQRRQAYADRQVLTKAWNKAHKELLREFERKRQLAVKTARQQSDAHWPNSNRTIQSYETGRAVCRQTGRRLHLFDADRDDGVLTYQIQRTRSGLGADPEELQDGTFAALQIGRVHPKAYDPMTFRGERDRQHWTVLEMRVDADGHRVRLPVCIHRPLPEGSRVKSAQITWRRGHAGRIRYQLCLTVSVPDVPLRLSAMTRASVDFLWVREGGLKVLSVAEPGQTPSLFALPPRWLTRANLMYRRRTELEEAIKAGRTRFGEDARWGETISQSSWLAMFDALQSSWDALPVPIREWYRQVRHNWKACEGLRAAVLGERRELYRAFAREVASRYAVLEVPEAAFAAIATAERGSEPNSDRHLAAPHRLRAEILHQARKAGVLVIAPGEDTSAAARAVSNGSKSGRWARLKNLAAERSRHTAQTAENAGE